jgi:hypothetical protein
LQNQAVLLQSIRESKEGANTAKGTTLGHTGPDIDPREKFGQARDILQWEELLKVKDSNKITLPELMAMKLGDFMNVFRKTRNAYDQAKRQEVDQAFLRYYQDQLNNTYKSPAKALCKEAEPEPLDENDFYSDDDIDGEFEWDFGLEDDDVADDNKEEIPDDHEEVM